LTDVASVLSQHLYDNWSLSNPSSDDIYWAKSKVEAIDFTKVGKNYVIACYAPISAANIRFLTREIRLVEQNVTVDILVRVISSVDDAVNMRETIRSEVYRILKDTVPSGFEYADVVRESNKNESPDLARVSVFVKMVSFS
jgi:hypothetical protein